MVCLGTMARAEAVSLGQPGSAPPSLPQREQRQQRQIWSGEGRPGKGYHRLDKQIPDSEPVWEF